MTTYKAKITLPDIISSFIQEVQSVAGVVGVTDQHLDVEFDEENLFKLGTTVTELKHSLISLAADPAIEITVSLDKNGETTNQPRES